MIRAGHFAVLTYDEIIEELLSGAVLSIPEGTTRLMLKADAMERLNDDLGFTDPCEEDRDYDTADRYGA